MSIREGIVGYFRFRATVQCPLVLETFWTGNRAIFPPSVFRCAYSEKSWIFFFCHDGMTDGTGVSN